MNNCIFCKILKKEILADIVSEDVDFLVFKDINPKAPIHLLIIPKVHAGPVNTLNEDNRDLIGDLVLKAKETAEDIKVSEKGYRLIFNVGKDAGMEVNHLHLHLLAGKLLKFEF